MATCYRHPDRETGVSCSRCGRSICPDCMTPTTVGMRCPECAGDTTEVRRVSAGPLGLASGGGVGATYALIGIIVLAYVVQLASGSGSYNAGTVFIDGALIKSATAIRDGAPALIGVANGEWWRIVTSGFLHAGFPHLLLNVFALYILGALLLEPTIGSARTVAVFAVSIVGGSFGALLLTDPNVPTVGASGGVYGLFGATLLIARHRGSEQLVTMLGFWLLLNLLITFSVPQISVGGHLGGLAAGALAGLIVIAGERGALPARGLAFELPAIAAIGVAGFAGALIAAGV